jgi:hypothetical protein
MFFWATHIWQACESKYVYAQMPKFYQILFFYVASNIKSSTFRICILVGNIIEAMSRFNFRFFEIYKHIFYLFLQRDH